VAFSVGVGLKENWLKKLPPTWTLQKPTTGRWGCRLTKPDLQPPDNSVGFVKRTKRIEIGLAFRFWNPSGKTCDTHCDHVETARALPPLPLSRWRLGLVPPVPSSALPMLNFSARYPSATPTRS
jgi:hypothetical protein